MFLMSLHYFQSDDSGILSQKDIKDRLWYLLSFRGHIFFGLIAISSGPIQFVRKVREQYLFLHKFLGYIYCFSVFSSSLTGLLIAQFSMGGWVTSIGFSLLSLLWFLTTYMAIHAVRTGDINQHKLWMYLSYGLSFSAITQRSLLLIPLLTTVDFMPVYQLSSWLPWMLNLMLGYTLYLRSRVSTVGLPIGDSTSIKF